MHVTEETDWPGRSAGRPRTGAGSVATLLRRSAALVVDWLLAVLVARTLLPDLEALGPLVVFVVVQVLLVGTTGHAVGHRLLGLVVVRDDGRRGGLPAAGLRTVMLALVIPALVMDEDSRGLHDRIAGTTVVRL